MNRTKTEQVAKETQTTPVNWQSMYRVACQDRDELLAFVEKVAQCKDAIGREASVTLETFNGIKP